MREPSEERVPEATTGPERARHADAAPSGGGRLFPYGSVVGIIDDDARLQAAVESLLAAGFAESDVHVLAGEAGVRTIDAKGARKGVLARLFRLVDGMGVEREHTARHVEALEAGHFVVTVEAHDDAEKTRAQEALTAHGGHFISHYSRWSTEDLAP